MLGILLFIADKSDPIVRGNLSPNKDLPSEGQKFIKHQNHTLCVENIKFIVFFFGRRRLPCTFFMVWMMIEIKVLQNICFYKNIIYIFANNRIFYLIHTTYRVSQNMWAISRFQIEHLKIIWQYPINFYPTTPPYGDTGL